MFLFDVAFWWRICRYWSCCWWHICVRIFWWRICGVAFCCASCYICLSGGAFWWRIFCVCFFVAQFVPSFYLVAHLVAFWEASFQRRIFGSICLHRLVIVQHGLSFADNLLYPKQNILDQESRLSTQTSPDRAGGQLGTMFRVTLFAIKALPSLL